jgi:hypothetical protein
MDIIDTAATHRLLMVTMMVAEVMVERVITHEIRPKILCHHPWHCLI